MVLTGVLMLEAIRQLERIRRLGRWMFLSQRLTQWLGAVLLVGLAFAVLDYVLRLPWWLRLVMGLCVALSALAWLAAGLWAAWSFRPALSTLALRAERNFPQLGGELASAVDFTRMSEGDGQGANSAANTRALVTASLRGATAKMEPLRLQRILAPARTLRWLGAAVGATLLVAAVAAAAAPGGFELALRRWLMPLGTAQWPTRQEVVGVVDRQVAPLDEPLRLEARVERGYTQGLRTWVNVRVLGPGTQEGLWRRQLMQDRSDAHASVGVFDRTVDLTDLTGPPPEPISGALPHVAVEVVFEAGDAVSPPQQIRLVPRPAVRGVRAVVEPPAYAYGLVSRRTVSLLEPHSAGGEVSTASALRGARMRLSIDLNKPMAWSESMLRRTLPGLADEEPLEVQAFGMVGAADGREPVIEVAFTLRRSLTTAVRLTDEFGLTNMSERQYRIQAVEDRPPVVNLLLPSTDEQVLAGAVVALKAAAQDDVGLSRLDLEAGLPAKGDEPRPQVVTLKSDPSRRSRLQVDHDLDLSLYELSPGDELVLSAVAGDLFELDGLRHELVRSGERRLRIIEPADLVRQLRGELAGVRRTAMRIETDQQAVTEEPTDHDGPRQDRIGKRLENQSAIMDAVDQRMRRNRLDAPPLRALVDQVAVLGERAEAASKAAAEKLDEAQRETEDGAPKRAHEEARRQQAAVSAALRELSNLLDQSKDVLALQMKLQHLQGAQAQVAERTRKMLAYTAARELEQLTPQQRKQVGELAESQEGLRREMSDLVEQMGAVAESLARQSQKPQEIAAAAALSEAANIAQRQGLGKTMAQASQRIEQNQLSQAGHSQQSSLDVIRQMLEELKDQASRRRQVLRRRLMELADSIRRLIEQQEGQKKRLVDAQGVTALAASASTLRVNTLAVADLARAAKHTVPAAVPLDEAATHQSSAVAHLRSASRAEADAAESRSLASLGEALELIEKLRKQLDDEDSSDRVEAQRKAYEQLAARQLEIHANTTERAATATDRAERIAMRRLGDDQADLRLEAATLGKQVQDKLIYRHSHETIDDLTDRATAQLRSGRAGRPVVDDQARAATYLTRMADALRQDPAENEFGSGSSGGGGGGGGGKRPLVTSLAELKLLRGLQEQINSETIRLGGQQEEGAEPSQRRSALKDLARQQIELKRLGDELIEQVQSDMQRLQDRLTEPTEEPEP